MIRECGGGITSPKGFRAAGVHCGVKRAKKDLALLISDAPAACGAVFTQNMVPAAPVLVAKHQLRRSPFVRAVVINSGNANACTGERGMEDAWTMVRTTAQQMGVHESEVLVSSTGVIGQFLPMERITAGITSAAHQLQKDAHTAAAEAIMTTDTFVKELALTVMVDGVPVTIGGMAKGSGMIAPNMATMLAFITTDAAIAPPLLQETVKRSADRSFNRITIDGDTSTNDMLAVLANGLAGNRVLVAPKDPGYADFAEALEFMCVRLSKLIVLDGEGATKFVEVQVSGARSEGDALRAARAIASSNLVKTALNGEDANWGRVLAAVGNAGIEFSPEDVEIYFGDLAILGRNYTIDFSEETAKEILGKKEIVLRVQLNGGAGQATVWTCDLSREYVSINANYRT